MWSNSSSITVRFARKLGCSELRALRLASVLEFTAWLLFQSKTFFRAMPECGTSCTPMKPSSVSSLGQMTQAINLEKGVGRVAPRAPFRRLRSGARGATRPTLNFADDSGVRAVLLILLLVFASPSLLHAQGTSADYERAKNLRKLTENKVYRDRV